MKLFSLIYNEFVKQFKKTSIRIIIPIILLSAVILPIGISKFDNNNENERLAEGNKFLLTDTEGAIDNLKNDKTSAATVKRALLEAEVETLKLKVEYKVEGYADWRDKEASEYSSAAYGLKTIELVLDGVKQDVLLENLYGVDPEMVAKYYEMPLKKKKEVEAEFIAKKEEIKNIIANNDFMKHIEREIKRKEAIIEDYKKSATEYEKLVEKNPKDEEGKLELERLSKIINESKIYTPQLEQDITIMKFRYDNKIDFDKNNWKNKAIILIEKELVELRINILTEKEFSTQASQRGITMSYDEYVENFKDTNKERVEKIKELWYGLEKNIPDLNAIKDARSVIDGTYDVFVILAAIVVIIIGGGIVSQEFANGTIRLLLIRPVSRWKILLSKLLATLIIGLGVAALSIVILVISSGVVFGLETLQTPVLQVVSGSVVEVSYIKYMLLQLIPSIASLLFIVAVVFTISTLAKNTSLAVAVSMLLYLGSLPLTMVVGGSLKQGWIVNTIIPYMNNSAMKFAPFVLQSMKEQLGVVVNQNAGLLQLSIVSVIMLTITFIIFVKKDVKN